MKVLKKRHDTFFYINFPHIFRIGHFRNVQNAKFHKSFF